MRTLPILFLAILAARVQSPPEPPPAMTSLVEAERAFARTSVTQGRREAFLAFFADDAIFFTPAPVNAKEVVRRWPAKGSYTLDWEPRFGDVAEAGDLGYTTGPFLRTPAEAGVRASGWYFTIWKKQPDGSWKVAIDAGIASPATVPLRPAAFEMARREASTTPPATASLLAADGSLCTSSTSGGWARALRAAGTDTTRLYRDGTAPMSMAAASSSYFPAVPEPMACEPTKQEVSRSADLGYTYGTYSIKRSTTESGYYLRVWKRQAGEWRLAVDLLIPGA